MIISIITVFQTKCFYGQINDRLERNPSFSIADSATFTFLLVYHKHDRSTFSINWWVRQCDPNHLINGTERSTGSALSSWSSLSGFDWGHYYHKHSCLLFSLSLSVTVMLCREKTVMLMSTKISTWVLYISALCSWYCCQSHSHCHDLGPIKMRLKTKWKLFAVFLSLPCTLIKQLSWQDHLFKETKLNERCIIFVIRGMQGMAYGISAV